MHTKRDSPHANNKKRHTFPPCTHPAQYFLIHNTTCERIPRHNLGKVKARRYLSKSFSLHTSPAMRMMHAELKEHAGKTMNAFTAHRFSKAQPLSLVF
jgi:hypothetical protein